MRFVQATPVHGEPREMRDRPALASCLRGRHITAAHIPTRAADAREQQRLMEEQNSKKKKK